MQRSFHFLHLHLCQGSPPHFWCELTLCTYTSTSTAPVSSTVKLHAQVHEELEKTEAIPIMQADLKSDNFQTLQSKIFQGIHIQLLDAVIILNLHLVIGTHHLAIIFAMQTNILNINHLASSRYQVFHM